MGDEEEEAVKAIGTYEGGRKDPEPNMGFGVRHGEGVSSYANGDIFEGTFVDGARTGFGTYYFGGKEKPKAVYAGMYEGNKKCGQGKMTYPDGTTYEGSWANDQCDGFGTYTYANGDVYNGEWKAGAKSGNGAYYTKAQMTELAGSWSNGAIKNGDWLLPNGSYYSTELGASGKPEGMGVWNHSCGTKQSGTFTPYVTDPEDPDIPPTGGVFKPWSAGTTVCARPATFEQTLYPAGPGDAVSKQSLKVSDPNDPSTMFVLGAKVAKPVLERTYAMIKPNAVAAGATSAIIDAAMADGFTVEMMENTTLSTEEATAFYAEHEGKPFFEKLVTFMTSGPIVKLVLQKENAILGWRALLGPTDSLTAKESAQGSIRALYGIDGTQNAAHGSDSTESAAREIGMMFPDQSTMVVMQAWSDDEAGAGVETAMQILRAFEFTVLAQRSKISDEEAASVGVTLNRGEEGELKGKVVAMVLSRAGAIAAAATVGEMLQKHVSTCTISQDIDAIFPKQTTCAVIKPDAAGSKAAIMADLAAAGYTVLKEEESTLDATAAGVLYKEHKEEGFFEDLCTHMSSGPVTKLLLESLGCVATFREMIGPTDPEAAKESDPNCLRAKYGTDTGQNALHGSKDAVVAAREAEILFATPLGSDEKLPVQQTYAMIKPDAVAAGHADEICLLAQNNGFTILKKEEVEKLEEEQVKAFYGEHADKEFFGDLCEFMGSGPVVKLVLERPNAIKAWRAMLGPTNPVKAAEEAPSCLRAKFGNMENGTQNAAHGSDATSSAKREIELMFPPQPEGEADAEEEAE